MAPGEVVASREAADRLVADLLARTAELARVLEAETRELSSGRLREGLGLEARKQELSNAYLLGLQAAKANMVALTRFVPAGVARLRQSQADFQAVAERNQAVLATAKAVSESLVKGVAAEIDRASRPNAYTPRSAAKSPAVPTGPLVFSGRF